MNKAKFLFNYLLMAGAACTIVSCGEDDPEPEPEPIVSTTITNLAADPTTGFDPNTGAPIGSTGKFTFFSFKTGAVVDHADSATNKWDIGFRATTIIVNSPTSGPGTSVAQVVNGIFDEFNEAPADGYKADDKNATIKNAIPTGSGNGWYTATGMPTLITPIAGKVIVVKTSDERYAKVEILSYYKDAPASPTASNTARYYTFRYVYQPNDTRTFE